MFALYYLMFGVFIMYLRRTRLPSIEAQFNADQPFVCNQSCAACIIMIITYRLRTYIPASWFFFVNFKRKYLIMRTISIVNFLITCMFLY